MTILTLLSRLREATGADREIDIAISKLVDPAAWAAPSGEVVPRYTASIDAALTLVPEKWSFAFTDGVGGGVGHTQQLQSGGVNDKP